MRHGQLSDQFQGVVVKTLSAVEARPRTSNQHEFNGSQALRALLGDEDRRNVPARFVWLGEERGAVSADGKLSWYDARRAHAHRTEYRLYYSSNEVTRAMREGDVFFLVMGKDGRCLVVVVPPESTTRNQLCWLFGIDRLPENGFTFQPIGHGRDPELDFGTRHVLEELGVEPEEPEAGQLDELIMRFGLAFPTTREFSAFARGTLPHVRAEDDPDRALLLWMDREERLFRRLERRVVTRRLENGFGRGNDVDVDGFLDFSLSVQNRRKARAGLALENHLEAVFQAGDIRYDRGAMTENRSKPDFLFPGGEAYHDAGFPAERLTMLGAKSTLKDRWRQVLVEAVRIRNKHLLTLEPGISAHQTREMQANDLRLVVPARLHDSFQPEQRGWLASVADFMTLVRHRQELAG